jgi:hypothetical protein
MEQNPPRKVNTPSLCKNIPAFYGSEFSFPYSQENATGPYFDPDESILIFNYSTFETDATLTGFSASDTGRQVRCHD